MRAAQIGTECASHYPFPLAVVLQTGPFDNAYHPDDPDSVCIRVAYRFAGMSVGSAFDSATRAMLPVRKRSGRDELVLWGRREGDPGSADIAPGVALDTVKSGAWDVFQPRWVKLFVDRYQIADARGRPLWHELANGSFLQGVLIVDTDEHGTQRVYVASIAAPEQFASLSGDGRWPHIASVAPGNANGQAR